MCRRLPLLLPRGVGVNVHIVIALRALDGVIAVALSAGADLFVLSVGVYPNALSVAVIIMHRKAIIGRGGSDIISVSGYRRDLLGIVGIFIGVNIQRTVGYNNIARRVDTVAGCIDVDDAAFYRNAPLLLALL